MVGYGDSETESDEDNSEDDDDGDFDSVRIVLDLNYCDVISEFTMKPEFKKFS